MKIDRQLNLVIQIEQDDGSILYVHAAPPSIEVFEANFLLLGKTFGALVSQGLLMGGGHRITTLLMRQVAAEMRTSADALLIEFRRLSNVIMSTPQGWQTVPMHDVVQQQLISKEDLSEVDNAIAFFSVSWCMLQKSMRTGGFLKEAASMWGALVTSLNVTEYAASLPMSKAAVATT